MATLLRPVLLSLLFVLPPYALQAVEPGWQLADPELQAYFAREVTALEHPLAAIKTAADWKTARPRLRDELRDMLGLLPEPERSPLHPTITGTLEREDFRVEKLHFQSLPGLYVTANLYLPRVIEAPLPAILYLCGHSRQIIDGVSYGNKAGYHHHGVWFARHGFACLTIDTLQLGEIEGTHHGTRHLDRWWWQARGYTPAGVEAWNGIRALDYLESRPEIDPARLGVTGRSGGGAYSWWVAALDDRIAAAVPVAGITSLRNHVVDGCIEGHCDCMFPVNSFRWDFETVAALVAPRPLLLSNTDSDRIFPLDGVYHVHREVRRIYDLLGSRDRFGFNLEAGPHKDTQPLRTSAFEWMNRHLRGTELDDTFKGAAVKVFTPADLKVFDTLPSDEINTTIDQTFVPAAPREPALPESAEAWESRVTAWKSALRARSFAGWPAATTRFALTLKSDATREGIRFRAYHLSPQPDVSTTLYIAHREGLDPADLDLTVLNVLDESDWRDFLTHLPSLFPEAFPATTVWPEPDPEQRDAEIAMHAQFKWGMAYLCPRGTGPGAWPGDASKQAQIRRRFALLGQTLDGMRVFDIRQAALALRTTPGLSLGDTPLWLQARGSMAGNALYAALFLDEPPARLDLHDLPLSHHEGPIYLDVLRHGDLPLALAAAAQQTPVRLYTTAPEAWTWPAQVAQTLGWPESNFEIRAP